MILINQNKFKTACAITPGQQFIIALWCELFNLDTIDSYRVRVMNAHSILSELEQAINDRITDDISINNILYICREAERILSNDEVCKKYYSSQLKYIISLLKDIQKSKKDEDLVSLRCKIRILKSEIDHSFLNNIVIELKNSIDADDFNLIDHFTGVLATELLNKGFSFEFLYFLKDIFLKGDVSKNFNVRWKDFVSQILVNKKRYKIYFKFFSSKYILQHTDIFDVKISSTYFKTPVSEKENEFIEGSGDYYGLIESVEGYDTNSAVGASLKKIDMLRNLARYEFRKSEFTILPNLLIEESDNNSYRIHSFYPRPVGFIQAGNPKRFEEYIRSINQCITSSNLDDYSKQRIINSFKYFRMSIDSEESEIRFILCWTALEFLLKTGSHSSIISRILFYLPKVISYHFFRKILIDFSSNLNRMIPKEITKKYFSSSRDRFDLKAIYELLCNKNQVISLKAEIENELLKYRIEELHQLFTNPKILNNRFLRHNENLEWNIQRIYRIRNKIVHSADTHINIRQLESNLTYYFTTLFNNIIYSASHSVQKTTIESILDDYNAKTDYLSHKLKNSEYDYQLLFE